MNRNNANKRRVIRELLNQRRQEQGQRALSQRGYSRLYGTRGTNTYAIMDSLLGVVDLQLTPETTVDVGGDLFQLYFANRGKTKRILYMVDGNVIVDRTLDIPDIENFADWYESEKWNAWMEESDRSYLMVNDNRGKIYITDLNDMVTPDRIVQSYLDGETNCVFTPIRNWLETELAEEDIKPDYKKKLHGKLKPLAKFEEQYKDGVPQDKMEEVALKLNMKFYVHNFFNSDVECYGKKLTHALKVFHYTNPRVNHLELGQLFHNTKPEPATQDFIINLIRECAEQDKACYYTKVGDGINAVYCIDGQAYAVKSEFNEALNELVNETGLYRCRIDDLKNPELSAFIQRGTHFNTSISFPNFMKNREGTIIGLKCIDQKKAYFNFKDCKYYEGFLGKITDFRKTNKIEGVGLYLIKDLNPFNCYLKDRQKFVRLNEIMNMYNSNNVYTSAELKFLDTMGWKYKIVAGCWGVETLDFDFGEKMLDKMGKKPFVDANGNLKMKGSSFFAVATGSWASHGEYDYKYLHGTKETAEMLREQLGEAVLMNPDIDNEICIRTRKTHINTLTHVSAFILAYQRLSLIEQLMEMDLDKLQSIYVDGIYYIDHEFKVLDTFQEGNCESYSSMYLKNKDFITQIFSTKPKIEYSPYRETHATELWTGAGGCGKTHQNLIDFGLVKPVYCGPSHKLNAVKTDEYYFDVMTIQLLLSESPENPKSRYLYSNAFIIDEVSMMKNEEKEILLEKLKGCRVIMCGDIGYQISAWEGTPFKEEGFEYYKHLTENYRVEKGDPLLDLLNSVRDSIKNVTPINISLPTVDTNYLVRNYKREDMILSFSKVKAKKWTDMFKSIPKWYIDKSNVHLHGMIFVQDEKPEGEKVQLQHGFTTCSIQGETLKHNIWIDVECMNHRQVLYTALSRAKKLSQIKFVTYNKTEEKRDTFYDNNIKCDCGQYVERGKGGDVYIHDYIEYYRWCEKCKN